ncbi:hypothetical protein TCAL_16809 [Tigriopus californicus]|uniref:Uncharacterized protein n=1 Tax=Tigriopus californicus TaxID=6832 RepID=A0A553PCG0_TIGCA|nr:hypothetical protein TCAL_16809 [Tigriopus californicus]
MIVIADGLESSNIIINGKSSPKGDYQPRSAESVAGLVQNPSDVCLSTSLSLTLVADPWINATVHPANHEPRKHNSPLRGVLEPV